MTPPYVVSIVPRFSPFRHKFVTICIFVVIFCRVGLGACITAGNLLPVPAGTIASDAPAQNKAPGGCGVSAGGIYARVRR